MKLIKLSLVYPPDWLYMLNTVVGMSFPKKKNTKKKHKKQKKKVYMCSPTRNIISP